MGKGRIVSGGEDGLYTVELLHNRDRINAEVDFLTAKLAELQADVDALEAEREGFVAERNAIATDIDAAVANAEEGEIPDVEALLVELAQVSAQIQAQDVRIAMIRGRMLEANKRKEMLESVPADPVQEAWCADYTEDLTGEVATVEVPAEGVVGQFLTWRRVQIRPGHAGGAAYNPARDGQMFHREGQNGYQAYYNAAILPGVQRWKPQYRIGVLTAIDKDADTCSLTIQGEDSSAQALIIDPPDLVYNKTGVPIEYMECNSDVFEVGDRVLVEFQGRDWNSPKVIGFEEAPKQCLPDYIVLQTRNTNQENPVRRWYLDGTLESYWTPHVSNFLWRTETSNGRQTISISMPAGFTGYGTGPTDITGVLVNYWTTSIGWWDARAYNETVGGAEEVDATRYRPDGWSVDHEIFVFKPEPSPLDMWIPSSDYPERIVGIQMNSLQLPGQFTPIQGGDDPNIDRYAEVWGYDTFYRQTVDVEMRWGCTSASGESYLEPNPCGEGELLDLRTYGSFALEVVSTDVNDIDTLSQDVIPTTLTISGVEYTRKDLGWIEHSPGSNFRLIAFVYARADVAGDPVEYAEGFWAE